MRSFLWTDQLHMRTKIELVASNSPVWPSWIFAESLRRTILMSHLLRGLYSCLKLGFCHNVASLAPLLFTARAPQWENPVGNTLKCVEQSQSPPVVSYYGFVLMSDKRRPIQAEAFERLPWSRVREKNALTSWNLICSSKKCTDSLYVIQPNKPLVYQGFVAVLTNRIVAVASSIQLWVRNFRNMSKLCRMSRQADHSRTLVVTAGSHEPRS